MQGRKYWFIFIAEKVISKRIYTKREATKTSRLLKGTKNYQDCEIGSFIVTEGKMIVDSIFGNKMFKQIIQL